MTDEQLGGEPKRKVDAQPRRAKAPATRAPRQAAVTTRTGDDGYTSLLGKERVPKWDPRPETFGTLDEATSALGLARAFAQQPEAAEMLLQLQRELYLLMAELATGPDEHERSPLKITHEHVVALEQRSERLKTRVQIGQEFILPGETPAGAAMDLARTIVRRGERLAARLYHEGIVTNQEVLRYLNRLSDLLFILARFEEAQSGQGSRSSKNR